MVSRTVVPRPGALVSSSRPPSSSARSRMPDRPKPVGPARPPSAAGGGVEPGPVVGDLQHDPVLAAGAAGPGPSGRWRAWPRSAALPGRSGTPRSRRARPCGARPRLPARPARGTRGPGSPGWRPGRGRPAPAGAARRSPTGSRPGRPRPVPGPGPPARPPPRVEPGMASAAADRWKNRLTMRWLMPSWISPASRRRSCSCHSTIRSANRSSASSRSASRRCSRAFSIAPATRPATVPEQFHVGRGELAAQPGVHVQHADQVPDGGDHRHRQHRGELLAAQRRDVAVPGVGGLVVHDHGGLAVVGYPAGHALAQRQLDGPDHGVERRGRAAQLQFAAPLVEQVHEAHVGRRWSR